MLKIATAGQGARRPWAGAGLGLPAGGFCRPMHIDSAHTKGQLPQACRPPWESPTHWLPLWQLAAVLPFPVLPAGGKWKSISRNSEPPYREVSETSCPHLQPQPPAEHARLCQLSLLSLSQPWAETMGTILGIMGYLKTWLGLLPGEQEALSSTRPS